MPVAKITPMGEHGLYHVHFLDGRTDPGFGQGGGERPDHDLPGMGGHPSHPIHRPPVFPDNSLPDHQPPMLLPGYTLVMVRGPHGKWEYAFIAPGSPPPRPLPPDSGNRPDNTLPGQPGRPDQGLPPYPDQGLPPGQPGAPTHPIAGQPGAPDQGLPPGQPGAPTHPIQPPVTAQPKR